MTRARALHTFPWVQAVFRPGARPRRVETGVRCRDCRDLRSPGIEAAGARRGLNVDQGAVDCSSTRALGLVEGLDVDEGMGDATGLGVTQRGGGQSRARTRRSPAEGLVFYKLPL